ncbi:DUF4041 domain-containing protein [Cellulomonas sp. NTE-D12]|uniref:DUF4041 domain-containing protein n=1 Tax=Cellulomonas sp. NTE-D12 TaxID=2962632 RepID=UPI0030816DA8|nr:hypothetical protein CELD12_06510 [Cellulomonas sp. NTE-D12]
MANVLIVSVPTPPNWYPDPQNPALVRWWDGQRWTEHVQPTAPVPMPAQAMPAQPVSPAPAFAQAPVAAGSGADGARRKVGLFGARAAARDLATENDHLRSALDECGGLELAEIRLRTAQERMELERLAAQVKGAQDELDQLRRQLVDVRNAIDVQEFGLYDFEHPAEASARLGADLSAVRVDIRNCAVAKRATSAVSNFTFNNSAAKGRQFVNEMSKMMLAAYNAEAENAIKTVRAGGLSTAKARLEKAAERVAKNGQMISLHITPEYHRLRVRELELAARHMAALQAEKEAERAHREELREAKRAEEELRREREKLDKEREHYTNALAALIARGDEWVCCTDR